MIPGLLCSFALALAAPQDLAGPDRARVEGLLQVLVSEDPAVLARTERELETLGDPALAFALEHGFAELPLRARRLVAGVAARRGTPQLFDVARPVLASAPDPELRRAWVELLTREDHGAVRAAERAAEVEAFLTGEHAWSLREEALNGLARLGDPHGFAALDRLLESGALEERRLAAALLGTEANAGRFVFARVQDAFARPEDSDLTNEVLALLLPAYGRTLAERRGSGGTERERAPFVLGFKHPDPAVRRGAALGFERWISRMRALGDGARARDLLRRLIDQGYDRRIALDQFAQLTLLESDEPREALAAARELASLVDELAGFDDRLILARARYLEALAIAAGGDTSAAYEPLDRAIALLDGLLLERVDLWSKELRSLQADVLRTRTLAELSTVVLYLAGGRDATDLGVIERARRTHRFALETQLAETRAGTATGGSLDTVVEDSLSPYSLLLANPSLAAWPVERVLAVELELGRAFAAVCPRELPGFEATGEGSTPLEDSERVELLIAIHEAEMDAIDEAIVELSEQADDPDVQDQILLLRQRKLFLWRRLSDSEEDGAALLEKRSPSSLALWLVADLRADGQSSASRRLAEATRADLEATGQYHDSAVFAAEVEMAIGSSYTDEGEPERAEVELLKAVERLEGLETALVERGGNARSILLVRRLRSNGLVSLAVNANVKLRDPDRALGYFERAFELRQDDFMRVLLACYRARSGREEEARAVLAEVIPSPAVYYNLACTYALLGDQDVALDFLVRELDENHPGEGSRARQVEWAREDPDLASLRGNPRFERLVGE